MRIKFLSFIGCCLTLTAVISSCMGSGVDYEYSSDATIRSFGIDTVRGVTYPFTIDQIDGLIYNADSLPFETSLEKVVVKSFTHYGYYVKHTEADTLFYFPDSMDFSSYTREEPLRLTVYSTDEQNTKDYKLWINVHQQEPDSIEWERISGSFSRFKVTGKQKTILWNNKFYTYYSHESVFVGDRNGNSWSEETLSGLPASVNPTSVIKHLNVLYAVTGEGDVYLSEDALNWSRSDGLSGNVIYLIAGFPDKLSGILSGESGNYFAVTENYTQWEKADDYYEVDPEFPLDRITSVYHTNANSQDKLFIMGENVNPNDTISYTWFSEDGYKWGDNFITTKNRTCPKLENVALMWYDNKFYAFGGRGRDGFLHFYTSDTGVYWSPVTSLALFPEEFNNRGEFSFVVDEDNYIWIFFSYFSNHADEVWKGRINRLGFIKK